LRSERDSPSTYQFDPVSERIMYMRSAHAGNVIGLVYGNTRRPYTVKQCSIVAAAQRRMSFLRRAEVFFDAKMNLHAVALKPAPSALRQRGRLGNFLHAEQACIEPTSPVFLARRHRELNVINRCERNRRFAARHQVGALPYLLFLRCGRHQIIQPKIHGGHAVVVGPTAW